MGALSAVILQPAWFPLDDASAVGAARRHAVEAAQALQLGERKVADLAIIATELGTNLIRHAAEGVLLVRPVRAPDNAGLELVSIDSGPGMADLGRFYRDGHSTAGTLGIGLGAVRRLADRYDAYSTPGRGTVQVAQVWQQRQQLGALARVGQGQQHVAAHHHAEVAVAGFGGMEEECTGAGAGQRGGDLARHVPALAQAADDHAPVGGWIGGGQAQRAGARECGIDARGQGGQRPGFHLQGTPAGSDQRAFAARVLGPGG